MKKLIIILSILVYSFLAMADEKENLVQFLKENVTKFYSYPTIHNIDDLTVDNLENIDYLEIVDKNISTLPNEIYLLKYLGHITLDKTNIKDLPKDILKLKHLVSIYWMNSNLNEFPSILFDLNLTNLSLSNNKITSIPNDITKLKYLRNLNLSFNNLKEFPNILLDLNLSGLYLNSTNLNIIPSNIKNLTSLRFLDIGNNNLKEFPKEICSIPPLYDLNISYNKISSLPTEIKNFTTLRFLNLSHNKLESLPKEIRFLTRVETLLLNNNKLKTLPKEIKDIFKTIQGGCVIFQSNIDISNNRLSFLSNDICNGGFYTNFFFHDNFFDEIPSCILHFNLGITSDINGTKYFADYGEPFFKSLGWKFQKDILIDYSYEDNKTIKFKLILGNDLDISSYLWSFGDGNTSFEENPIHTYSNYGDYNIVLSINNNLTFSKKITITPKILQFKKGWNLITPPTKDDINGSIFDIVWSYENSIWDNNHSFLTPSIGYWVKLNQDLNYSYSGEHYKTPNYKIKNSWNLIGSGEKIVNFDETFTYYIYRDNLWIQNPTQIKVGEGVWVKR